MGNETNKKEIKEIQKPITVRREELKRNLIQMINDSGLYAFMVQPILVELMEQAQVAMKAEYQTELNEYNKMIAESKNDEEKQD